MDGLSGILQPATDDSQLSLVEILRCQYKESSGL
jgi:hypothetical protein